MKIKSYCKRDLQEIASRYMLAKAFPDDEYLHNKWCEAFDEMWMKYGTVAFHTVAISHHRKAKKHCAK